MQVDPAKVQAFVTKLIGSTDDAYTKAKTVDPSTVTVSVLNGGAANGAAGTAAATLKAAGFTADAGDSPAQQTSTTIVYPGGMESQAKTLAQYVPGAAVRKGDVATLTLTLGSDGVSRQVDAHREEAVVGFVQLVLAEAGRLRLHQLMSAERHGTPQPGCGSRPACRGSPSASSRPR